MRRWLPYRNHFLHELLRHEGVDSPSSGGTPPVCHHPRTIIKTPAPCPACESTSQPSSSSADTLPGERGHADFVGASSNDESSHANVAGLDNNATGPSPSTSPSDHASHDHLHPPTSSSTSPSHSCGRADYRCRDCLHAWPLCKDCILSAHQYLPFHGVEVSRISRFLSYVSLNYLH